jgi:glycosyltransferase involved in cell wall biosynthesis
MKLLVYSHSFPPNFGGIETIVLSLARGLAEWRGNDPEQQLEVTLVTQTPAGDFDDRTLPFLIVRRPGVAKLWRLIRGADVIHLAGPALLPLLLGWLRRKPILIEHHGYQAICPNGLLIHQPDGNICPGHFQSGHYAECYRCQHTEKSWWRSALHLFAMFPRHWIARRAARNIAVSQYVSDRLALPSSLVIYHGIDETPANISPQSASATSKGICFAYVGRLVAEKGLLVLLKAVEIAKRDGGQFQLLLIGDGPERHRLEDIVQQKDLREYVRFTGFMEGSAFADALRRVDVVVMPSAWEEAAGLAAIEQMMRGRLVIASRIGGLGEIIADAALTCEPGSPEDLALRIQEVLQNPGKVQAIGAAARERAHRLFLRDRMIVDHARVYGDVLGARSGPSKK